MKKGDFSNWLETEKGKSYLKRLTNEMWNEIQYYSDLEKVFNNPDLPYLCELILS